MPILRAKHIQKTYRKNTVVKDVSLEVRSGEIVGLLGPNGAGKTTTSNIIVGQITPDQGEVFIDQQRITHLPMHARARMGMGYLPQDASIFRKLTVAENIMAILELRRELNLQRRQALLDQLLEEFSITHIRDNMGASLSGGERRRVEVARTLASEPRFILLDEPFAGVDPISVLDIKNIIKHLQDRDIGILITDHNVRETLDICGRAYIVSEGDIIAAGQPKEILQNEHVRRVYLGEAFVMQDDRS